MATMKRVIAIAGSAAPLALKLAAAANVLFFLAFLATLLVAAHQAHPGIG
jgi:hypothetical protein